MMAERSGAFVKHASSGAAMVVIDEAHFEALIFDLDGVITQTASLHALAWKRMFDEFMARQAAAQGRTAQGHGTFAPFDLEADYRRYVDGKPRIAGALSFLAARGIAVPTGAPADPAGKQAIAAFHRAPARSVRFCEREQSRRGRGGTRSAA